MSTLILAQTKPNCANIRIPRSRSNLPQASLKLARMIFHSSEGKIRRAKKTSASLFRKLCRPTLPLCKMGKMQSSQAASMTRSPLDPPPKILTNGNKGHNRSLAKVGAKLRQTTRFWRKDRKIKLRLKDIKWQENKRKSWWKFSENSMAKSRSMFDCWLHRKPDWTKSKCTSGFSTKKDVRQRT
jgi:hypothetical protein